jgi:NAD(P)H-hydrate epimerase
MHYFSGDQIERLDQLAIESGLEVRQMMELAGYHIVGLFKEIGISREMKIVIVCGKGNKGGDGLSAARHLVNYGWEVSVILISKEISSDSVHHMRLVEKMNTEIIALPEGDRRSREVIASSGVVIDALIGYHLKGSPYGKFQEIISFINGSGKRIVAYDLPSGLDATSGECPGVCIRAAATITLAIPKRAFETVAGRETSGDIYVADIGIPAFLYNQIAPGSRPDYGDGLVKL